MPQTYAAASEPIRLRSRRLRFYRRYSVIVLMVMSVATAIMIMAGVMWPPLPVAGSPLIVTAAIGLFAPRVDRMKNARPASWIYFIFAALCGAFIAWIVDPILAMMLGIAQLGCYEANSDATEIAACIAALPANSTTSGIVVAVGIAAVLPPIVLAMFPWRRGRVAGISGHCSRPDRAR